MEENTEDKKITFSITIPQSVVNEVDKLVKQPRSPFANRSHAFLQFFYTWENEQEKTSNKSPQLETV